jgi:hypothetical protein
MSEFKMVKDCVQWLGGIGRGTTWDEAMEALEMEWMGKFVCFFYLFMRKIHCQCINLLLIDYIL